ncbi:MAG TPA: GNAT family N-acetyltransferase [Candidatus Saccharimonadia bacterium]|jgi:ribosomal-protein-serine acetyltransferase
MADRFVLVRRLVPGDAPELFELIDRNRSHLTQFDDDTGRRYFSEEEVRRRIENPPEGVWEYRCSIRDEVTSNMVGFIKLTRLPGIEDAVEIGYFLGEEFQGQGYMTSAIRELTNRALTELGFREVWARVHNKNSRSSKALMRCGYKPRGTDPEKENWLQFST